MNNDYRIYRDTNQSVRLYLQNNRNVEYFSINFNNNENKSLSLAYWCRNSVAGLDKFDANGASIFRFSLNMLLLAVLILMLVYMKQYIQMQECRLHNIY